jgi:hypothetical protein
MKRTLMCIVATIGLVGGVSTELHGGGDFGGRPLGACARSLA